ncbi:nucleotidyl transferase AbiEii/AbiGii toxin family protein [Candidatus Electronema sp. TJ]|uniref:nucleotidyl transferase AbiEii/AbiGii toxin family protein n=1 Tax=Candidatus Electronema sp. TJ TaxID=3401573 RepID=UPI003AA9513E
MEHIDYNELYRLQDEVLNLVFAEDTEFYLTGGTCLSRFYFEQRYSDDLDLFTHCSDTFSYSARAVIERFVRAGLSVKKQVDAKDFVRLLLTSQETALQVDFVNDRVKRFGDFVYRHGFRLDNPLNILSNKITAVIGRDNPKDIFDILLISKNISIDWSVVIAEAGEKLHFQKEDLLYRLETFPAFLLKKLNLIDEKFLDNFDRDFKSVIEAIQAS